MKKKTAIFLIILMLFMCTDCFADENIDASSKLDKNIKYDIFIDLNELTLSLYERDTKEFKKSYPISVGKIETPSPIGNYHIKNKSNMKGPFGGYFLGLDVPWDTFGIHGTNRPDSIGMPASHGCFRMSNYDIVEVFNHVDIGASVIIYPGPNFRFAFYHREIHPNDKGFDVYEVQRRLKDLGYFNYIPDGIYNYTLEEAVLYYKFTFNLGETTTIDDKFLDALGLVMVD